MVKEGSFAARVVRALLLAVIGYCFFIFHGLSSHLNPWSQAVINAAVKHFYPKDGQKDITVLLFREDNLASLDTHYPVPYQRHADIIEALASYAPRAVFIDFAFVDNRDDQRIRELSAALCTLRDASRSTAVYLAAPVLADGSLDIAPELLDCATPVTPEMDAKSGESGVLTYLHGRAGKDGHFVPSAAFAMAREQIGPPGKDSGKLEIVWGKGVAPLNLKWMDCREKEDWDLIRDVLSESPAGSKLPCPYHRTISVSHLLNSAGDPDIEQALTGRTVFYGAGFRFTGDRVESPVYGEMPGVYLHAMAYDNLLSLGDAYKRADREGWLVKAIDAMLLLAAAFLLVFSTPHERTEAQSLIEFNGRAWTVIGGGLLGIAAIWTAVHYGGLDSACLTGLLLYLAYRIGHPIDWTFVILILITLGTTLLCYFVLDLGPRNILAFLAFFEIVEKTQGFLLKKAKTYHELHEHFGPPRRPHGSKKGHRLLRWLKLARWVFWTVLNKGLQGFFWMFQQPATSEQEPKS